LISAGVGGLCACIALHQTLWLEFRFLLPSEERGGESGRKGEGREGKAKSRGERAGVD